MRFGQSFNRRALLVCAVVFALVALVLALGVLQPVQTEVLQGATKEEALTAFRIITGLNFFLAAALFSVAVKSGGLIWMRRLGIVVGVFGGLAVLLSGLLIADAASAYRSHGPAMQTASTLLFICATADVLAGVLAIVAAIRIPVKAGISE